MNRLSRCNVSRKKSLFENFLAKFDFRKLLGIFILISTSARFFSFAIEFQSYCFEDSASGLARIYQCLIIQTNNTEIELTLSDNSTHLDSKGNIDVSGLSLFREKVPWIPPNIGYFYPNLKFLQWYKTSLESITAKDLKQFPNLEYLDLRENRLVSLDNDLFRFSSSLKWIYFGNNPLKHVGSNILDGLNRLELANFDESDCIDYNADSQAGFDELKSRFLKNCAAVAAKIHKNDPIKLLRELTQGKLGWPAESKENNKFEQITTLSRSSFLRIELWAK